MLRRAPPASAAGEPTVTLFLNLAQGLGTTTWGRSVTALIEMKPSPVGLSCMTTVSDSRQAAHIDVLLAHHNHNEFLPVAVESILSQTYPRLTLHVIDDASTTSPLPMLKRAQDGRIKFYQTSRNVGHYRAKNALLPSLKGPLVAFQDADDYSLPDRFAAQAQVLRNPQVGLAGCSYEEIQTNGAVVRTRRMVRHPMFWLKMGKRFVILSPTIMCRYELLLSLGGFDGTARIAADSDFVLRASLLTVLSNARNVHYRKRIHKRSLTYADATGYNSTERERYRRAMQARHAARHQLRGADLRRSLRAPTNDIDFDLVEHDC